MVVHNLLNKATKFLLDKNVTWKDWTVPIGQWLDVSPGSRQIQTRFREKKIIQEQHTVDGKYPAPVEGKVVFFPLFTGFQTSQHQQYFGAMRLQIWQYVFFNHVCTFLQHQTEVWKKKSDYFPQQPPWFPLRWNRVYGNTGFSHNYLTFFP